MKTMRCVFLSVLVTVVVVIISSCGSGKPEIIRVDPAFRTYVSAYTSGMISRKGDIRIELQDTILQTLRKSGKLDAAGNPDSTLLKEIFSFEPEIEGKAIWENDHAIIFHPEKHLPVNQLYTVSFNLERLAEVKSGYEDFRFQFATYQQDLFVEVNGLTAYDDYNLDLRSLQGTIRTTDFEDTTLLKQTLRITHNGKPLDFHLREAYETNEYYFEADSIRRTANEGTVVVSWNGKPIQSFRQGSETITVPALGDFTVSDHTVMDLEDQVVELRFSEPIMAHQELNGLITIDGIDNLTFSVAHDLVTVYLPNRFEGTKKLIVHDGIRNVRGHRMQKPFSADLVFEAPKPRIRIKGGGSILPASKGLIFPFEAISLKAVDVRIIRIYENNIHHFLQINDLDGEDGLTRFGKIIAEKKVALNDDKTLNLRQWNTHVIDLSKWIKAERGAIYRVSIKFRKEYSDCGCEVSENTPDEEEETRDEDWSEENWHGYGFDGGYDSWSDYSEKYSACSDDYYYGKAVSRNILASDLGVIFKLDEDHFSHAFVSDMLTTEPVANAEVQYFDFTKQLIASGTTDANGMLDIHLKRKPFLMITKRGEQRGYLKLGDGYTNSLSEFEIDGEQVQNGVKGFIYGERGVWRPGDSLYLSFILQDLRRTLPANHPVQFSLLDPNGQIVYETSTVKHVNNIYDFRTATSPEAMTGGYTAEVKVGNRVFTKYLRIETVKPNRLKIYMNMGQGIVSDTTLLAVKWLHGAIAKSLRATVSVKVNQMETIFPGYKNYVFDSPVRAINSDMELIHDGNLNEKGEALINTHLDLGEQAPGMLRAHYITKVYEAGGDFSIDRTSMTYSPFSTYVGLHTPESAHYDGTLETDKHHKLALVTVDETGKPVNIEKVQVKIYKLQWRWWYEQDEENLIEYMARSGTILVKDTTVSTKNGKASVDFCIRYPEYGRYLVTATDLYGNHQTGKIVVVDYPFQSRANHTDTEHASMLSFSTDKRSYTKGEDVKLSFPSPANGKALVSIETSRKVVKKFWVNTVKGETSCSFKATEEMSPNAYVHVSLIQPHASTVNDLPIRMYGVVPIMVDDPATHLYPEISMPDQLRPESTATIRVKEQNGRRMAYTLEIVDEGLLDLTAFKTPQPWHTFYAKEALGVQTWDIYDYVIGAFAGKLDKLLSIGGDGSLDGSKGPKANRFKPVVLHLGPFVAEAGETRSHTVTLPEYVGSVRVMVVAHNEGAYGNAEKTVAVKKPLMVLATLPRVLGPGEQVQLPVNVFAMEKHIRDVNVTVEVNDMLTLNGGKQQRITFKEPGDEVVNFSLSVAERVGIAKVKVTSVCGNEKAVQEIELDVRPANPIVYETKEMVLQPGKEWTTDITFKGITGTNRAIVECSSLPSIGLEKRLTYLIDYPHGCIEQTTSGAFPQLYLKSLLQLTGDQQQRITENVKAAIKRIQLFQTSGGGFSYWPGEGDASPWGTNYAGHFLLEAEQQGYALPNNLKTKWIDYQQREARGWSAGQNGYGYGRGSDELTQAYRLYVLALAGKQEVGAMNRLRELNGLSVAAKWRLAAAYLLVGRKDVAEQLTQKLPTTVSAYNELSYSYGSDFRDQAMILETLSLLKQTGKAVKVVERITAKLRSDSWLSTQETAYSLLALCTYADLKGMTGTQFSCELGNSVKQTFQSKKGITQIVYGEKDITKKTSFRCRNNGSAPLYIKVIVQCVPKSGDRSSSSSNLKMKLVFRDLNGNEIQPDRIVQGTDFVAEVTITNPGKKGFYKEMALTQIFPSGWEIHNTRMDGGTTFGESRYQDIRDDRVYSYYELMPNASKTFRIQLNATYLGRFYLPTTYSEAMYDHSINARSPGKWVEVVKGS